MEFDFFCELCFNLKNNSKKLLKTQILSDYLSLFSYADSMLVCDLLSGNFAREISKKELGISIKSVFEVLSSYYLVSRSQIEDLFYKSGDIFQTVGELEFNFNNESLSQNGSLTIEILTTTLKEISLISGKNSNLYKKNKLLFLFSLTKRLHERQILVAYLSDLLKIGVNEGLIHDAFVFTYFPKIENFYRFEENLGRFIINEDILESYLKIYESGNYKLVKEKFVNLGFSRYVEFEFVDIANDLNLQMDSNLDMNSKIFEDYNFYCSNYIFEVCSKKKLKFPFSKVVIRDLDTKGATQRLLYNEFKSLFDSLYAFNVSYEISFAKLQENILNLFNPPIIFNKPVKVMLGPRMYSFEEVGSKLEFPLFCDYKYDGLRLIIQNNFGDVKLFSRNLENLTSQFLEVISFMRANFSQISCVLDCECVGFDKYSFAQVEFQELSKRIMTKSHNLKSNIVLGIRIFDILEFKGEFVHSKDLEMRQELLRELFKDSQMIIDKKRSSADVVESLNSFFSK
ncbi:MAG: hypothetical protein LAT82_01100 [Nanoarchaeota archaeon]|nr:hypothetical protein [Nanoarchaeota archaeon]